jgi:CubicO group peptidase (beta-lactamase class C family)
VTEKVTVLSWEELITTMLFQPLGMTTAGFGPMGIANQLDQPWQHLYFEMAKYLPQSLQYLYSGEKITPVAPNTPYNDLPPVFRPAGLVHVSLKDWAKFIIMHLEGEQGGSKLLKPETFKILHTPPFDKGDGYALGWDVKDSKLVNAKTLWHSGSNMVSHAEVFAVPERDFAVLIATNIESPGTIPASSDALIAIIDKFFKAK